MIDPDDAPEGWKLEHLVRVTLADGSSIVVEREDGKPLADIDDPLARLVFVERELRRRVNVSREVEELVFSGIDHRIEAASEFASNHGRSLPCTYRGPKRAAESRRTPFRSRMAHTHRGARVLGLDRLQEGTPLVFR